MSYILLQATETVICSADKNTSIINLGNTGYRKYAGSLPVGIKKYVKP
jgi:hypothetical protein